MAGTGPTYPLPRPACEGLCQGSPGTTTGLTLQLPEVWPHEPLSRGRIWSGEDTHVMLLKGQGSSIRKENGWNMNQMWTTGGKEERSFRT